MLVEVDGVLHWVSQDDVGLVRSAGFSVVVVLPVTVGDVVEAGQTATTGRAHFWSVTLQIIKAHPMLGTGLGAFGVVYTKFDSRNGLFRLEQAHNDYLQVLSDGGILGGLLALSFVVLLFYLALKRARSQDDFRRGVADLDGTGDVVSGIVVMRQGENALRVIESVKAKLEEIKPGLPEGVEIVTAYEPLDPRAEEMRALRLPALEKWLARADILRARRHRGSRPECEASNQCSEPTSRAVKVQHSGLLSREERDAL